MAEEIQKEISEEIVEEPKVEEIVEEVSGETEDSGEIQEEDPVKEALERNAKLKAELEELKNRNENVFEENAALQKEVEAAKKMVELAKENEAMQAQLQSMKRDALVEGMIANGKLPKELKSWSEELSVDQLKKFNEFMKPGRTILDEKNFNGKKQDANLKDWYEEQSKSRIL